MTKREASENLATALSELWDAVVMAIRQLDEPTQDDPPEPEIKPGELVYAWFDRRPEKPTVGWLKETMANGTYRVKFSSASPDSCIYPHIERFYMPFDWERWPGVKWVVDFDNTTRLIYENAVCPRSLGESFPSGFRVIRILKRPEGK